MVPGARGPNPSTAGESGRSGSPTVSQWDILCSIVREMNSPSTSKVFMADACHLHFGKYTLFLCYGVTANSNPSPVALLFFSETKTQVHVETVLEILS